MALARGCDHEIHAPMKPHEDAKKSFDPQSPVALKWAGDAKNPWLKVHKEKVGVRFGSWNVGCISGRGTEVCEELRKRQVDVCCLQKVRWRGKGARFFGVKGRRYKLWWCGNDDKTGGVGILVKEELCENVEEVRSRCDKSHGHWISVWRRGGQNNVCLCTTKWKARC